MLRNFLRVVLKHNIHEVLTPAKNTTPNTKNLQLNDSVNSAGAFSFKHLLYLYEYNSAVGASFARDLRKKTLTSVNGNQNQNRKLNRPVNSVAY